MGTLEDKGSPLAYNPFQDISKGSNLEPLSEDEISAFFHDIDLDDDGIITFDELERKLEQVHEELEPNDAKPHHLHHPDRRFGRHDSDLEKEAAAGDPEHDGLVAFLHAIMPGCKDKVSKSEFTEHVKSWNVPSQNQTTSEEEDSQDDAYEQRLSWRRRFKSYWSVQGPKILFTCFVIALQLAFGLWQGIIYIKNREVRAAVGWGVILAKFSAGALYPTLFFMVLSMSRWFATIMRRFHYFSLFVNWDRSQSFHIWMACVGLILASLHAIGHLTGTFLYGSRPAQQAKVRAYIGPGAPQSYAAFVRTLPGWSGLVCLGLYYVIAVLSWPRIRSWSYELFQLGHLLMFPMLGLLCAHGTAMILQHPMLGYWLAFPFLLVIIERSLRLIRGLLAIKARMQILDDQTVTFTCKHPRGKSWRYQAGQYVFLQVPSLSFFQWHPFTISACVGDELQLHIKTDGDWTSNLRRLPENEDIRIGLDGPFGAPAQRFYDFDRAIIVGAGVGITPFSAILTDLEQHLGDMKDPWEMSRKDSRAISRRSSISASSTAGSNGAPARNPPSNNAPSQAGNANGAAHTLLRPTPSHGVTEAHGRKPAIEFDNTEHPNSTSATDAETGAYGDDRKATVSRRRVDMHWLVRERNHLLWFSSLLNRAHSLSLQLPNSDSNGPSEAPTAKTPSLTLNITPHITAKRKNISTHVFRYLLDSYRTRSHPHSALTGLAMRSSFGRPDLAQVLADYHDEMLLEGYGFAQGPGSSASMRRNSISGQGRRVGVFFCGHPKVGRVLADACAEQTARARADGSLIRYVFLMEVFG